MKSRKQIQVVQNLLLDWFARRPGGRTQATATNGFGGRSIVLKLSVFLLISVGVIVVRSALARPDLNSDSSNLAVSTAEERAVDRQAIRAQIDRIFRAYLKKNVSDLRATHHPDWLGYQEGSRSLLNGIEAYLNNNDLDPASPYGMKSYEIREFEVVFKGDAAFVVLTAEVESNSQSGLVKRLLRITGFYTKENGQWIEAGSTRTQPESTPEQRQGLVQLSEPENKRLLHTREAIWRAYFSNDQAALERLVPIETTAIDKGDNVWGNRSEILKNSAQFSKAGGKLVSLEFLKTDIRTYERAAVVYSSYSAVLATSNLLRQQDGRTTEVFVMRDGRWVNPGCYMDIRK